METHGKHKGLPLEGRGGSKYVLIAVKLRRSPKYRRRDISHVKISFFRLMRWHGYRSLLGNLTPHPPQAVPLPPRGKAYGNPWQA